MSSLRTNEVPDAQVVNVLVENHRAFLRFLERKTGDRALAAFSLELERSDQPAPDLQAEICGCVSRSASTLCPECAAMAGDVGGQPVKDFVWSMA